MKKAIAVFAYATATGLVACNAILDNSDRYLVGTDGGAPDRDVDFDAPNSRHDVTIGTGGAAGVGGTGGGASGTGGAPDGSSGGRDARGGGAPDVTSDDGNTSTGGAGGASTGGRGGASGNAGAGGSSGDGGVSPDGSGGVGGASTGGSTGSGGAAGNSAGAGGWIDGSAGAAGGDANNDGRVTCLDRRAEGSHAIFVAAGATDGATGADASSCGDITAPCSNIAEGLARARAMMRNVVYVAQGTYVEWIALHAGVRIEGAWSATGTSWSPICDGNPRQAVTIQAPSTATVTVIADALGGQAELAWLTVKSKPIAGPGESLSGIFARGASTQVLLEEVDVVVNKGGDGSQGATGTTGSNGAATGCSPAGDGSVDAPGSIGDGAPAGSFGSNGYVAAQGSAGSWGRPGKNGTAPAVAGSCSNCYMSCGTSCVLTGPTTSCGTDGIPGCPGGGGGGGDGGQGGGSSIALYAWDATVRITASSLRAGDAGNGAVGGPGGAGGSGAAGVAGGRGPVCVWSCEQEPDPPRCLSFSTSGGAGGPGGTGGNGSLGGQGGGGSGGSSFAIYRGGASDVAWEQTMLTAGARRGRNLETSWALTASSRAAAAGPHARGLPR